MSLPEDKLAVSHQDDPARRRRLRWRARRGLLENDIVLERFFDRHEATLTDSDVTGLDELLALGDNELMDLILARKEPDSSSTSSEAARVLQMLRTV